MPTPVSQGAFPIVPYPDPRAAIGWLERAFGAEPTAVYPPEPDQPLVHAEVRVGGGIVITVPASPERPGADRPAPLRRPVRFRPRPANLATRRGCEARSGRNPREITDDPVRLRLRRG